jgi:hypothetical protein
LHTVLDAIYLQLVPITSLRKTVDEATPEVHGILPICVPSFTQDLELSQQGALTTQAPIVVIIKRLQILDIGHQINENLQSCDAKCMNV